MPSRDGPRRAKLGGSPRAFPSAAGSCARQWRAGWAAGAVLVGIVTCRCGGLRTVVNTAPFSGTARYSAARRPPRTLRRYGSRPGNERPVAAATVVGSWAFERGIGLTGPAGFREFALETNADGRYLIRDPVMYQPAARCVCVGLPSSCIGVGTSHIGAISSSVPVNSGTISASVPTRCGLRSGSRRWKHRRHLAFLGGGAAIAKVAGWEAQPASLEQEGRALPQSATEAKTETIAALPSSALDVSPLLSAEEVRGVTGFAGDFEVGRLADRVRSDVYDSRHFKAKGKSEAFDVAVRVWAVGTAAAEAQFGSSRRSCRPR